MELTIGSLHYTGYTWAAFLAFGSLKLLLWALPLSTPGSSKSPRLRDAA